MIKFNGFLLIIFCCTSLFGQDINFSSEYNKVSWPVALGLSGGITGDDGQYKRLALYHGGSISLQTGSNSPSFANSRIFINQSGLVGIGTTNPQNKLEVHGATAIGQYTNGTAVIDAFNSYAYFGCNTPTNGLAVGPTGNVGIGTTSPTGKLEVASSGTGGSTLVYGGVIGSRFDGHELNLVAGTPIDGAWTTQHGGQIRLGGSARGDSEVNAIQFIQNGIEKMRINNGGNVGIGTTSPNSKLVIYNGSDGISFNPGIVSGIGFNRNVLDGAIFNPSVSAWQFSSRDDRFTLEGYNGPPNSLFTVLKSGFVGIGTNSPDAKLAVNGQIHATEVKVTTTVPGPDYVFEPSYHLSPLDSIKTYIDKNKHLPEVPSAKEMEKNGVNLGEMNMLLLKKIEELTLYVIEQNKRIDGQQNEIKELKQAIKK